MLRNMIVSAILLVAQSSAFATQFPLVLIESFNDSRVVIYVNESDIRNTPDWEPGKGAPPLDVNELVADIEKWRNQNPDFQDTTIREFELKPILNHEKEHRWYYLVQMKNSTKGKNHEQYLAVLMNGKILPAIREPSSYK